MKYDIQSLIELGGSVYCGVPFVATVKDCGYWVPFSVFSSGIEACELLNKLSSIKIQPFETIPLPITTSLDGFEIKLSCQAEYLKYILTVLRDSKFIDTTKGIEKQILPFARFDFGIKSEDFKSMLQQIPVFNVDVKESLTFMTDLCGDLAIVLKYFQTVLPTSNDIPLFDKYVKLVLELSETLANESVSDESKLRLLNGSSASITKILQWFNGKLNRLIADFS